MVIRFLHHIHNLNQKYLVVNFIIDTNYVNKRGSFVPPFDQVISWKYLNKDVISEDIDMDEFIERKCVFEPFTDTLYCINTVGTAFSINKTTLLFIRSVMFNMADLEDDIGIGYGSCQEF